MSWLRVLGWIGLGAITSACAVERPQLDSSAGSDATSTRGTGGPAGDHTSASPDSGSGLPPSITSGPQVCEGGGGWVASSGAGGSSGDGSAGMGDDMPLSVTIAEIQQGDIPAGTRVIVSGVVVTSSRAERDSLPGFERFVQDPLGGPWSGLRIQIPEATPDDGLSIGDIVDVRGSVTRRADFYAVEVSPFGSGLTWLGVSELPAPALLPVEILTIDGEAARAYEGVPIRVEQVVVTNEEPCDGEFVIDDTLRVDDRFVPGGLVTPPAGSFLGAVEGVLIFAEDSLELGPRDPGELG